MTDIPINFFDTLKSGRSRDVNTLEIENMIIYFDRGKKMMFSAPGMKDFSSLGATGLSQVRGLYVMGDYLYAVRDNTFYQVTSAGVATSKGTLASVIGPIFIRGNSLQVMVTDEFKGYIYTISTGTFEQITDPDFPTPLCLEYQDGYFIVFSRDTERYYISDLLDGLTWNALDFTSADVSPDKAVGLISDHRDLFVLGETTTEIYYNSGNADFPFERVPGAFMEVGIASSFCAAKIDNSVFFLGHDRQVRRVDGYKPVVISPEPMNYQLSRMTTVNDAIGFCLVDEGHAFYWLTFPTENKTYVYDASTQLWHLRSSKVSGHGRHRANCYAYFAGKHIIGDYVDGKLYELDRDTYTDDGAEIRKRASCELIRGNGRQMFFNRLELEFEMAVGLTSGSYTDPTVSLEFTDDAHSWGYPIHETLGAVGAHGRRVMFNQLGAARERAFRWTITDPVKVVFVDAYLDGTAGLK